MSVSVLPPVTLTVIQGVALFRPSRADLKVSSSLPVQNGQTFSVTGSWELFLTGASLSGVVAVHDVTASAVATATASRTELRLSFTRAPITWHFRIVR